MALIDRQYHDADWWANNNPVLAAGAHGYDTTNNQYRIGDGSTHWNDLTPHAAASFGFGDAGWFGPGPGAGGAVSSVNGQVGDVTLDAADVGAEPVGSDIDASRVQIDTTGFVGDPPGPIPAQDAWAAFDNIVNGTVLPGLGNLDDRVKTLEADSGTTLVRRWDVDGLAGVKGVQYWSAASPLPGGEHTLSIHDDSLRIHSNADNTDGSRREAWLVSDEDFDDFEILVRIDKPSNVGVTFSPQPGLMLRGEGVGETTGKGIALFVNIFASYGPLNIYNFRPWTRNPDGSYSDGGASSNGTSPVRPWEVRLQAAQVDGGNMMAVIDNFNISDRSKVEEAFAGNKIDVDIGLGPVESVNDVTGTPFFGAILCPGGGQADVPLSPVFGNVRLTDISTSAGVPQPPDRLYPAWLRVQLVGRTIRLRWWHDGFREPDTWDRTRTLSQDAPLTGKVGLVTNHLHGQDNYMAYGPVEITPIKRM